MKTTQVQIRISQELKTRFEKVAEKSGLDVSSTIRFLMKAFSEGDLSIGIQTKFDKEIRIGKKDFEAGHFMSAQTGEEIDSILS